MLPIMLPDEDRAVLENLITCSPSTKECGRAQALVWLSQGCSVEEIADRLAVHRRTVYRWARRFSQRTDGPLSERLADAPRSGRPPIALGVIDPLIDKVIDEDPQVFGYHYTGWTADLLRDYLQDYHGIAVSRQSVRRAIDRLAIHWKRPRHTLANRPETWRQAKGGLKKGSSSVAEPCC
jgi:transposase